MITPYQKVYLDHTFLDLNILYIHPQPPAPFPSPFLSSASTMVRAKEERMLRILRLRRIENIFLEFIKSPISLAQSLPCTHERPSI